MADQQLPNTAATPQEALASRNGYLLWCVVCHRPGDPPMIEERDGELAIQLDRYAIIPLEKLADQEWMEGLRQTALDRLAEAAAEAAIIV